MVNNKSLIKRLNLSLWDHSYVWIGLVLWIGIYWLLFLQGNSTDLIFKLYMNAEKSGSVKIHLLGDKDKKILFTRKVSFPKGEKGHLIGIPNKRKRISLRFQFDEKPNNIKINKLIVQIGHKSKKLDIPNLFVTEVIKTVTILSADNTAIQIEADQKHSALELHNIRLTFSYYHEIVFLLLTIFLIFIIQKYIHQKHLLLSVIKVLGIGVTILFVYDTTNVFNALYRALFITTGFTLIPLLWFMIKPLERTQINQTNITGGIIVSIFLLLICTPVMKMSSSEKIRNKLKLDVSKVFKSNSTEGLLNQFHKTSESIEKKFTGYFYKRRDFLNQYAKIKLNIFKDSPKTRAIYGKNGMFFEGYGTRRVEKDVVRFFDSVTDYAGLTPFTIEQLEQWCTVIDKRYHWLKKRGIGYVFALAPTKAQIYPENLPDRISKIKYKINHPTRYDQLIDYLQKNSSAPIVDLRHALKDAKASPPHLPLYYRTDFHWNYYGAYIAYKAIMKEIEKVYPEYQLKHAPLSEFTIKREENWVHNRFIGMLGLYPQQNRDETYLTFLPNKDSRYHQVVGFRQKNISDYSLPARTTIQVGNKELPVRKYYYESGKLPRIFIIGDSFIAKASGYFSIHGKETYSYRIIDNFPGSVIDAVKPTLVIQELVNMYILRDPPKN